VFDTNLAFQQRDLAFSISFHGEVVTKGPPPKCFQAYGIVFFLLGCTGTGSHNYPLFIVKNPLCVDGGRNTCHQYHAMHFGNVTRQMVDKNSLDSVSVHILAESEPKNCSIS